jgi:hypothetical protein
LRRRDLIRGSFAAALALSLKGQAASLLPALFSTGQARPLRAVRVGTPAPLADNRGDTWVAAWAGDDNLYSPSDDTSGFHSAPSANVAFNRIEGSDPFHLTGTTVSPMQDYGKGGKKRPRWLYVEI